MGVKTLGKRKWSTFEFPWMRVINKYTQNSRENLFFKIPIVFRIRFKAKLVWTDTK